MKEYYHTTPGYHQYRAETGFITNFSSKDHIDYDRAIKAYCGENPDYKLHIGEPSNSACDYGLYLTKGSGLTEFWHVFEKLQDERIEAKKRALSEQFGLLGDSSLVSALMA